MDRYEIFCWTYNTMDVDVWLNVLLSEIMSEFKPDYR